MAPTRAIRAFTISLALAAALLALASCKPEPLEPTPSDSGSPSASVPATATPAPTPTVTAVSVPSDCSDVFSASTVTRLETDLGPLNAAGFELVSTQNGDGLDLLASGTPTVRCTWGVPGKNGLSTNVTAVTAEQAAALQTSFEGAGYSCSPVANGVVCTFEQKTVTLDDKLVTRGESQFLGGNRWVATAWVGELPDGYTEAVVAELWG